MSTPDYKRNDPKGWYGDPRRGAALGRSAHHSTAEGGKFFLRKVRLDNGGYDANGTYFGHGDPLYWCTDCDEVDFVFRAESRAAARAHVLEQYPEARFYG
jgi:hypothetical protein